ncbi:MAG: glycosyltransferase family 39 protein [Cyanophyceae cyanobacterium]
MSTDGALPNPPEIQSGVVSSRPLPRWIKGIALVLILLGIGLRCTNLDLKPFWEDEVYTITRTAGYQRTTLEKQLNQKLVTVGDLQRYRNPGSGQSWLETGRALASAAEHTPLYFLLLRPWTQIAGTSVAAVRFLSVVFSIIGLGVCYLLGRSLFPDDGVAGDAAGWGATTLSALSPMLLRYSQEARPYSLWLIFVGLSIWTLLRAWRSSKDSFNKKAWALYGVTLVLAFYTQLLTVLVIFAQGAGLVIYGVMKGNWAQRVLKHWGLTTLISLVFMGPWVALVALRRTSVGYATNWLKESLPFATLIRRWGTGFSYTWLDFPKGTRVLWPLATVALLTGVAIATVYLWRQTRHRNAPEHQRDGIVTLFSSTFIPALIIVLMDVVLGGRRSTVSRYVIPAYLGLVTLTGTSLSLALAGKIGQGKLRVKTIAVGAIATVLVVVSGVSSVQLTQANTWWGLSKNINTMAAAISDAPQAVVVSDRRIGLALELAFHLPDNREIWWTKQQEGESPELPEELKNRPIALFSPSDELKAAIAQGRDLPEDPNYSANQGTLWLLPPP